MEYININYTSVKYIGQNIYIHKLYNMKYTNIAYTIKKKKCYAYKKEVEKDEHIKYGKGNYEFSK